MKRLAIIVLGLTVGCKPASLKLSDELGRSSSWLATVAATRRTTAANRTPSRYADDVFRDARDELAKASRQIADSKVSPDIAAEGRRLIAESHWKWSDVAWLEAAADTLKDLSERARKQKQ